MSETSPLRAGAEGIPDAEFRLLAENIPTLCWIADADGYIVWYNRRWYEYTGTTPAEMEGWGWQSVHDPDQLPAVLERWASSIATGEPFEMTFPLRGADGLFRPFLTRVQSVRSPSGEVVRWFGVNADISAQAAAEAALRERESLFRGIFESRLAGFAVVDLGSGTAMAVNDHLVEIIGQPREVFDLPDPWRAITPAEYHHLDERAIRQILETGQAEPFEKEYLRGDGSRVPVRIAAAPVPGHRHQIVVHVEDISVRREAEQALRQSEERYRRIFEQASDMIITATLDQIITDCNPAAAAAVEMEREEVIGRSIMDFLSEEGADQAREMLRHKLAGGGTTQHQLDVITRTGRTLHWEVNSTLTLDLAGEPVGLHAIARDVTERRRAEEHQRLLVNELNHRVKNTLSIVQGLAQQSFKRDAASGQSRKAFEGRLAALAAAHDLLTQQKWESASLHRIVEDVTAPHREVSGRFRIDGPDWPISPKVAVSLALGLHELCTNAAKYGALSNGGGEVEVRWTVEAGRLKLVWRESGGPPVAPPSRRGFGTTMIERGLTSDLGGKAAIAFDPSGVICTIEAELTSAER